MPSPRGATAIPPEAAADIHAHDSGPQQAFPISVVVALISGRKDDLRRCLTALHDQDTTGPLEIIVPYDDPCADAATLASEFPALIFIRATSIDTARARRGHSREHHDSLRTIGLRAASHDAVALLEDHAYVARNWRREVSAALNRHPDVAAVGGAVECDSRRLLNWAVWFCDFGRYQNPLPDGPAEFVSDTNVVYRREALMLVAAAWHGDYHETSVHWAMIKAGRELRLTPAAVVWQARDALGWKDALRERFVWGRSFAGTRAKGISAARRVVFAALSPLLPLLMTWRLFRLTLQRGTHVGRLVTVLPHLVLLQTMWAAGECVGYLTGDPG